MEWEEERGSADEGAEAPELDWGFMDSGKSSGSAPAAPGHLFFSVTYEVLTAMVQKNVQNNPHKSHADFHIRHNMSQSPGAVSFAGLKASEAIEDKDSEPVHVESADVKKEMEKISFPEVQGDIAPAALIPKACGAIQKQIGKLQAMIDACNGVAKLTMLQ